MALIAERLEQVVERIGFEGADRMLIVRGHEYRERHPAGFDSVDDAPAIEFGHLDVQEHQVRALAQSRRSPRCRSRPRECCRPDIVAEQIDQPLPRWRFVIDDQHAKPLMRETASRTLLVGRGQWHASHFRAAFRAAPDLETAAPSG